jgi:pimeloyl-ACP methyl ester carboxylesterase
MKQRGHKTAARRHRRGRRHHIYLVPGFLGFASLGRISYFGHVRSVLVERFAALGVDARIHVVHTHPTTSMPTRASRLAETIAATAGEGDGPIHLIGHSSGGLDIRLLAAPDVALPTEVDVERLAARVRTVVAVSTPHHGTPLASFFTTMQGQRLLKLLAVGTIYVLQFGRLPLSALLWMGSIFARFDDRVVNNALLDELFGRLLTDFTPARRRAVRSILREVVGDQALMLQLTPEAMDVFNASVVQRKGVLYGSVVSQAARPSLRSTIGAGLDPGAQATRALYGALYSLTAATSDHLTPRLGPEVTRLLRHTYGAIPSAADNDGIVPTRSQVYGHVLHAAVADHLDVLGYFGDAAHDPPHVDWVVTGSGFTRPRFEALWGDVSRFLMRKNTSAVAQEEPDSHEAGVRVS